ncbi:DUF3995 domain-containing protein [Pimelobacter simplex]|uniref:DUF3995 domain-containing protein n=1 Tax=Nocardioides simplex TaxID=2045 RepID=UPI00366D08CD
MPLSPRLAAAGRRTSGLGLAAAGALHLVWATGSPWPARSRDTLADAVTGSPAGLPPAPLTAAVGAGLLVAAAGTATTVAPRVQDAVRGVVGTGLLARAALGGRRTTVLLGMPAPSATFVRFDARVYRPLVAVLGAAVLAGIESAPTRRAPRA